MEVHNSLKEKDSSPHFIDPQKDSKLRYQELQEETDKLRISLSREQEYSRGLQEGITELRKELLEAQQKLQTVRYMERRMDRKNEARGPRDNRRMPATARAGDEDYRGDFHHFRQRAGSRHDFTVPEPAAFQRPSHKRPFHRSDMTNWRRGHADSNPHFSRQMLKR